MDSFLEWLLGFLYLVLVMTLALMASLALNGYIMAHGGIGAIFRSPKSAIGRFARSQQAKARNLKSKVRSKVRKGEDELADVEQAS